MAVHFREANHIISIEHVKPPRRGGDYIKLLLKKRETLTPSGLGQSVVCNKEIFCGYQQVCGHTDTPPPLFLYTGERGNDHSEMYSIGHFNAD